MLRQLTGIHLVPAVVRFRRFRSGPLREQLEALFGCPVEFGSDEDCLVFERAHMDFQIQSANPETSRHFEAQVSRILEKQERPFVLVVTRTIEEQLTSGDFSQKRVARRLSLSTRTLQRRLGEQGMRFNELVDEVRKNLACRMLKDPAVSVYSVAFAAGYDDVSSFNRAFKRWTRSSPSAYRGMHSRS
jgi:AraC-like DNA-binding protein